MADRLYREKYRPQFHFTAKGGWINDPNGLVFHEGEYHLFFQHVPPDAPAGSLTWGHAVSTDLVHWSQLPNAIVPYDGGTIFSGSAVVDHNNSSGFQHGTEKALVAFFTHAREPFGQAAAYSVDRGRTWTLYSSKEYVVPNQGMDPGERDPRVFWHDPTRKWV
ncbi:MAG TPA: glycoside hydrolase family 32 protein, partial [bacterium]|nr:glycoside hydrolase family 32 protein [bacterium]